MNGPTVPSPAPAKRVTPQRQISAEERRRAQRVLLRMPVLVHLAGKPEPLRGVTHTVSESGAMIILKDPLVEGTKISIENIKTQQRIEARVVRPAQSSHEGSLIPIGFSTPAPNFWNIFFPPDQA